MGQVLNDNIKNFLKIVNALSEFDKVEFIVLYGSAATGRISSLSDIDICIYYNGKDREAFNFRIKLLGLLPNIYDIQIFQQLPSYLKKEILKGEIIYVKNKQFLYDTALKTIEEFEDFKTKYYDYINRPA